VQLLVGLGNPGDRYRQTRHNAGFRFLDHVTNHLGLHFSAAPRLQARTAVWDRPEGRVLLIKPQTFMNDSGHSVAMAARYYHIVESDIFVAFDDLDMPSGKIRLRHGGGHGGHNGLKSINQHLGNPNYVRIKIGIGRPDFGEVTPWVLGKQTADENATERRIFDCLQAQLDLILAQGLALAANHIHLCLQKEQED